MGQMRLNFLGTAKLDFINNLRDEMISRDLTSISKDKLIAMFLTLEENIANETRIHFTSIEVFNLPSAYLPLEQQSTKEVN